MLQRAPVPPDPTDPRNRPGTLTPAHMPMVILLIALLVAVILGVGTGSINERTFEQPVTQPGAPITVP